MFSTIRPQNTPHSQLPEGGFQILEEPHAFLPKSSVNVLIQHVKDFINLLSNDSSDETLCACVPSSVLLGGALLQGCPGLCLDIRFFSDKIISHVLLLVSMLVEGVEEVDGLHVTLDRCVLSLEID